MQANTTKNIKNKNNNNKEFLNATNQNCDNIEVNEDDKNIQQTQNKPTNKLIMMLKKKNEKEKRRNEEYQSKTKADFLEGIKTNKSYSKLREKENK